jgi:hypothetical protein
MTNQRWLNLALASISVFYIAQIALDLMWHNLCGHLGVDYCAFWSAGAISTAHGYPKAYDLGLLAQIELRNFPAFGDRSTFAVSPFAYLPVFLPPFQLFAMLPAAVSFWIWTLINVAACAFYLRYFYLNTRHVPPPRRMLTMLFLSLPVYWNFLDGQVNVWLMICIGEFMRLMMSKRPFPAGLWLGGLLLKPQTLLLLGPLLLLRFPRKAFAGLLLSSAALGVASIALVGVGGLKAMLQVWLGFSTGLPTNDVDSMMNWRMIAFHLSQWLPPAVGWVTAALGTLATIAAVLPLWRNPLDLPSKSFAPVLLGTLAGTALIAWHSHIHMAMILIPPLVLLWEQDPFRSRYVLEKWVLLPAAAYLGVYVLAALIKIHAVPGALTGSINLLRGGAELTLNAWILSLVVRLSGDSLPT